MPDAPRVMMLRRARPREKRHNHEIRLLYMRAGWKLLRQRQLRLHPLCEQCESEGLIVAAVDVDHIVPHRGNEAAFHDPTNLQSLCKRCHGRKTRAEST